MIEVIYKEEKQEAKGNEGMFAVPRNIRQIGLPGQNYRIYVEDYVYTFLVRLAGMDTEGEKGRLAVLTGESKWQAGVTYVFVKGAITVEKTEAAAEHIDFTENAWKKIHDEQELYFPGQEIVGWFFAQPELPLEVTEVFKRVHLKYFGGWEKVLMLMDTTEREDAFFHYENNFLVKLPGYYLFYEKNPQMQNYMVAKNEEVHLEKTEEVPDEAVIAFRKIIHAKKKTKRLEKKKEAEGLADTGQEGDIPVFSYAATACLAIALLAVGVNFYRDYRDGYGVYEEVSTTTASAEKNGINTLDDEEQTTQSTGKAAANQGESTGNQSEKSADAESQSIKDGDTANESASVGSKSADEESESSNAENADETDMTGTAGKDTVTGNEQNTAADNGNKQETDTEEKNANVQNRSTSNTKNTTENTTENIKENTSRETAETSLENSGETGLKQNDSQQQKTAEDGTLEGESAAYQEESDVRKAARKEALAGQETSSETESTDADKTASGSEVHATYVIRPGDTLYQISIEKYGSMNAISRICELNGISPEEIIYPGQVIVLP